MKKINKGERNSRMFYVLIFLLLIITIIFFMFIRKNKSKNIDFGNNKSSQEIVDNILNIESYESKIEAKINSNKNENKYILKQKYNGEKNTSQEILEPENMKGIKIIQQGENLKIENNKLELSYILENYNEITNNILDLSTFIKDYKNNENSKWKENNDEIIMEVFSNQEEKILYINKKNSKPVKMEVKDDNKNTRIYIKYNEISLNQNNK